MIIETQAWSASLSSVVINKPELSHKDSAFLLDSAWKANVSIFAMIGFNRQHNNIMKEITWKLN